MAAVLPLPDERDRAIKGRRDAEDLGLKISPESGALTAKEDEKGGLIVSDETQKKRAEQSEDFYENLAEVLEENELNEIARDLERRIDVDKQARLKRDQQYEEGLKRTGIGEDAPGGASFTGASRATHPMLTEACVDFHAAAMKELFPPDGPVKTEIIGEQTPEQLQLADRQKKYMNWYLTEAMEEYADELSVTLTQVPMGGSQYMKFWFDEGEGRICTQFVPIDDLLLPYKCASFWSAHRITHVQRLSDVEYEERVENGMYRDIDISPPADVPETTKTARASDRIEGVEEPIENIDGLRIVYEVNTYCKVSVDGEKRLPYLVSMDERSHRIVGLYRNWDEQDRRQKRLHWIVDYNFIPWRGAYKMGLAQMLGGLSVAATGALRALLDSALVQTVPVLAKLKGAKFGAQTKTVDPLQITEVEAGVNVDDIRKLLMALPFNPPSPVLYALLGWLTEAAKGVVTTAEEKIADAGNNMPVGTSLALIEQGAKVYSTIHAGLHRSQKKALHVIAYILKRHGVDEEGQLEKFGEVICATEDFAKPLGVIPVSDPNIFSEGQRYAQMQLVMANAQGVDPKTGQPTALGALHNLYACTRRTYELAKIPNIDELLPPPKKPTELNSAAENSAVMLGNPVMAFPEQDHLAHLETHLRFVMDPMFGGNPAAVPQSWPMMIEHIKQHLAFLYAKTMHDLATKALGQDISVALQDQKNWPKVDQLLAAASRIVHEELKKVLQPLGGPMNAMIQKIEAMKPPPPMDPGQASVTIAKMEDARERDKMQQEGKLKGGQLQHTVEKDGKVLEQGDRKLDIQAADVAAKHNLSAEKLEHDKEKTHTEAVLKVADHLAGEHDRAHGRELAVADQQHAQGMDHRAADREDHDQQHRHQLEERGAQRDDAAAQHTQRLDVADHRLREAEVANNADLAQRDQRLKEGGQAHSEAMDVLGHVSETQNQEHTQRMDEADLGQRQLEHKDTVREQQATRKEESRRHEADLKAREKETKARAQQKPKGGGNGGKKR